MVSLGGLSAAGVHIVLLRVPWVMFWGGPVVREGDCTRGWVVLKLEFKLEPLAGGDSNQPSPFPSGYKGTLFK